MQWCVESDAFQLRIIVQDNPLTRCGILSTVCSVYDPLGFVSPVVLIAKQILQELCRDGADWDDSVPESIRCRWEKWRNELYLVNEVKVQRCFKPSGFEELKSVEFHHFSDASTSGYGQCSYVRLVNQDDEVHCALDMGKSRVTPLKSITIPRLELTAALVSVKVSNTIHRELQYNKVTDVYWTDSKVVLGYLRNESRRFHVFVANRVQQIRDETSSEQWQYVESKQNPADDASRGLTAREFLGNQPWLSGPQFLWNVQLDLTTENNHQVSDNDPEVRANVFLTQTAPSKPCTTVERLEYFSDWHRAKRAIAVIMRCQRRWKASHSRSNEESAPPATSHGTLTVEDLHQAELVIVQAVQQELFAKEIQALRPLKESNSRTDMQNRKREMKKTSSLYRLDPFLDEKGVLRVGGRLTHANTPYHVKHPMILPRKGHLAALIIRYYHQKFNHQGRGMTMNALRANGFWITGGGSAVARYIADCITCQKLRAPTQEQKMADLPKDRTEPSPPFTFCGVDYFGPWRIKEGRRELKRYGVIFTCLASRAIHLEVAASLETDSFINALRRFLARRGPIRILPSDQGTNLVGARNELSEALKEMNRSEVREFLLKNECDWIEFQTNVPAASHMGGSWERQIRTVRNVLNAILNQSGTQLNEESLHTFMCETEAIINSRPLTTYNLASPSEIEPLTPNHLLTTKSRVLLPPPGEFQKADVYWVKGWRRVQYLVNQFWSRWRKEYLNSLQPRQKWTRPRRNMRPGDLVLVSEENVPRNCWRLARVEEVHTDQDGLVRKVKIVVSDSSLNHKGERVRSKTTLERPVQMLVLLMKSENDGDKDEEDSPTESHN